MTAASDQEHSAPFSGRVAHHRNLRSLFTALARLEAWRVPIDDALGIGGRASGDAAVQTAISAVRSQLAAGASLSAALQEQQGFWGERTIALIRHYEAGDLGQAFRRLATGAAEPPLLRPLIACLAMGSRRTALCLAGLGVLAGLVLPVLPHQRTPDGQLIVLGTHRGSIPGFYTLLGTQLSWGDQPRWQDSQAWQRRDARLSPTDLRRQHDRLTAITGNTRHEWLCASSKPRPPWLSWHGGWTAPSPWRRWNPHRCRPSDCNA